MDVQKLPNLQGKLITRSKSKTSVGDRELVNFLENLSKDETGAPVKWKFNKSGIKLAKGIGKKIADASKPSSAVYVDSTIKLAQSVLRKHVKKQISDHSMKYKKQLKLKKAQESSLAENLPIKRKRGRPKKVVKKRKELQKCQLQEDESSRSVSDQQPVERKRGRPKKIIKSAVVTNEKHDSKNWTQLSKKVFHQSLPGMAVRKTLQNKIRGSSEERGDSDRIDSEMETESVDSNISGSSELKRQKKRNFHGIKLGPKKLLRSQDSLITRHAKDVGSAIIKANRKPRKRTLSGEFELLDESSLRKKMKLNDDSGETIVGTETDVNSEKKRGRTSKAASLTGQNIENDTNVNISAEKNSYNSSSVVDTQRNDSESVSEDTVQTFSVKSMKHPSLLRKSEIRNINLKKSNEEDAKSTSTKMDSKNLEVIKRKPGRPSNKFKNLSTSENVHQQQHEKSCDLKTPFTFLQQNPNISMEQKLDKPVRGLQIVGPGGMKFTKKVKCDSDVSPFAQTVNKIESDNSSLVTPSLIEKNHEHTAKTEKTDIVSIEKTLLIAKNENEIKTQDVTVHHQPHLTLVDKTVHPKYNDKEAISGASAYQSTNEETITIENKNSKVVESSAGGVVGETIMVTVLSDYDTNEQEKLKDNQSHESCVSIEELNTQNVLGNAKELEPTKNCQSVLSKFREGETAVTDISEESFKAKVEASEKEKQEPCENSVGDENLKINVEQKATNVQSTSIDGVDKTEETVKENIDSDEKKNESQSHSEVNNSLTSENNSEFLENQDVTGSSENRPKNEKDLLSAKSCTEEHLQHEDGGSSSKQELNLVTVRPSKMQTEVSSDCNAASRFENPITGSISVPKDEIDSNKNSKLMEVSDCISGNILDCKEEKVSNLLEKMQDITCTTEKEVISDLAIGQSNNDKMNSEGKETTYIPVEERSEQSVPQEIMNQAQKTVVKTKIEDNTVSERPVTPNSDEDNGSSTSELNTSIVDSSSESHQEKSPEKTVPEKRQIQLRQKASRSPLEIIAMRQSLEERQYLLEQSQKALKREEKQKKMKEKHKKIVDEDKDKEKEVEKDVIKEVAQEIVKESAIEEYEENQTEDALSVCKPCSVVLIDFVKYLKTTKTSYSVESGSVLEEWETVEENDSAVSPRDSSEPTTSDQESSTNSRLDAEAEKESTSKKCDDDMKESTNILEKVQGELKPVKRKRKASARKQVRSVTYSAQLTAEIVSNPMLLFTDETQTTVPPLRLKIKQNIIAKPRIHKPKRGLKFTTKKQHKARKGMSPMKSNPPPAVIEAAIAASEPESKKQRLNEVSKKGFVGSFVQFIQDQEESTSQKRTQKAHFESMCRQIDKPIHQGFGPPSGELVFPRFKCSYKPCSFVALSRSVIESHIYVHLKNIPFKCCYCNNIFNTRNGATMHMRSMHANLEAKIEPASSVDEKLYYEEITEDGRSQASHSTPSDMLDKSSAVNHHTQEPLIIKVVLPQSDTGCYYCVYCDFSAANQQDILDHIHSSHDHAAQYACSVCNKVVQGSKDEMASHFAEAHPNQQLVYKYLPDLFGNKNNQNIGNQDKGNIFDRMNDLFSGSDNGNKKAAFPQKTSAEADSTTAEMDENNMKDDMEKSSAKPESQSINKKSVMMEEGQGVENTVQFTTHLEDARRPVTEGPPMQNDDMGLKIVDVVSLRDQLPEEWFPNQEPEQCKTLQAVPNPVGKTQVPSSECQQPVSIIDTVRTGGRLQQRPSVAVAQPSLPVMSQNKESKIPSSNFGTTYKCEKCNVHAPVLSAMVEHLRVTHKDIARLFLCPYCRQYEGASEPEIHRHIKQFHHSPNQKSPPVALSSAAKKHLRTIQVPAGDARKVGDKFVIERDIYKCLKCQKHMPSLDYIYDHLEKTHNEVFVYVCPYCKVFKAKKEEVVFLHIRSDHNKNATDIMLSLAIEENLFTRIQSLMKDKQKSTQKTSQNALQTVSQQRSSNTKPTEEDVIVVGESRPQAVITQINSSRQVPNITTQLPNLRPSVPLAVNQQPVRMPFQSMDKPNAFTFQPRVSNSPMNSQSKSSLRKSRPHHIPPQNPFTQRNISDVKEMEKNPAAFHHMVPRTSVHSPSVPQALLRGPPPLLKISHNGPTQTPEVKQYQAQQQSRHLGPQNKNNVYTAANQLESFATTANMHSSQGALHSMANTMSGISRTSRPVLKVPSVTSQFNRQEVMNTNIRNLTPKQPQTNSPMFTSRRSDGTTPLDLSRPVSEKPNSVVGQQQSFDDELPPDAFQIFNLRPAGLRMPVQRSPVPIKNMNRPQYQAQIRQPVQQMGTMPTSFRPRFPNNYLGQMNRQPPPYNAIPAQRINNPLTSNNIVNQNVRLSAVALQSAASQNSSPIPGDLQKGAQNLAVDNQRVFKCPYCPNIVPLSMGEVAPHTEKFHPGHSIVFMKIDKLT